MFLELLEKPEIGPHIIEDVLILILHSLHKYKEGHTFSREIVATLTSLLDDLKPEIVWNFLCNYVEKSIPLNTGTNQLLPNLPLKMSRLLVSRN